LTGDRGISPPKPPIGRSTPSSVSSEIYLRVVSGGTSYTQFRLDFHPYTQLIRAICTSAPVRSSTHVSIGFNLATHRSTGFGCLTDDYRRAHLVPRPCGLRTFRFPFGFVDDPLNLAISLNSLARYSKRIIRYWSILSDFVPFIPYKIITVWFHALLTSRKGYFSAFAHATTALSDSSNI
jgi:hypothetical protein